MSNVDNSDLGDTTLERVWTRVRVWGGVLAWLFAGLALAMSLVFVVGVGLLVVLSL